VNEYEVDYQFDHLPGKRVFYYSKDQALGAEIVDNLKVILKKIEKDLVHRLGPSELSQGYNYSEENDAVLKIKVKDVSPWIEPRFISVNDRIVGVLGGDIDFANTDTNYRELTFKVPSLALETKDSCHLIKIESAEMSPGAPADDYLIQFVELDGPTVGARRKIYEPVWHIGEFDGPNALGPPYGITFLGRKKERQAQYLDYIKSSYKEALWMDHHPETWKAAELQGREYIDCI
jgi:hypothetical protein